MASCVAGFIKQIVHSFTAVPYSRGFSAKEVRQVLYGRHPVRLALICQKRIIYKIFYNEKFNNVCEHEILQLANLRRISAEPTAPFILDDLARHSTKEHGVHQGFCAHVGPLRVPALGDFSKNPGSLPTEECVVDNSSEYKSSKCRRLWLALCCVGDPMNLGSIIRSAYFLGVEGIILSTESKLRSAKFSPVVSKASAGTLECWDSIYTVTDMASTLRACSECGWTILGSGNEKMTPLVSGADVGSNCILLIGNEGFGVPSYLSDLCSKFINIAPGRSLFQGIDSLNVSVATALLIKSIKS